MGTRHFIYQDGRGNITARYLENVSETEAYLQGICKTKNKLRTFLKSRVLEFLEEDSTSEERLAHYLSLNPSPKPSSTRIRQNSTNYDRSPEICFTGFKEARKAELINLAQANGLFVRTEVSKNLTYLCCGNTAGPKKIEKARHQRVLALTEEQFIVLLETGEIPDHE